MTSKCANCGHHELVHSYGESKCYHESDCPCEKFIAEDDETYNEAAHNVLEGELEKNWKKEKKGCGNVDSISRIKCGQLCPSCNSNQSSGITYKSQDNSSGDSSKSRNLETSGDNSPLTTSADVGDTKTLSDNLDFWIKTNRGMTLSTYNITTLEKLHKDFIAKLKGTQCLEPIIPGDGLFCNKCITCREINEISGERLTSQEND